jgi:hypothetical protein
MPRSAIVLALTAGTLLALTACGGDEPNSDTSASPSSSPSLSPSETLMEAADGTDYDACFDGSCEVLVTGPVDIELDPDLGIGIRIVSVTQLEETFVGFEWSGGNAQSMSSGSVGWDMTVLGGTGRQHTTPEGLNIGFEGFDGEQMVLALSIDS